MDRAEPVEPVRETLDPAEPPDLEGAMLEGPEEAVENLAQVPKEMKVVSNFWRYLRFYFNFECACLLQTLHF